MHPKFRHFAAPFVITVAAACGSPQPQQPPPQQPEQRTYEIISNPPPPMIDAGPTEQADAALLIMPGPISAERHPGIGGEQRIVANPPRPASPSARVIEIQAVSDGVIVSLDRGSLHALEVGFVAKVFDRDGTLIGEMTLMKVMPSRSVGKLVGVTMERAKTAHNVALSRP